MSDDERYPLEFTPAPWMTAAACAGLGPSLFFLERGVDSTAAKQVCQSCPVMLPCREFALTFQIRHGVWGGLSERQRRQVRSIRRGAA